MNDNDKTTSILNNIKYGESFNEYNALPSFLLTWIDMYSNDIIVVWNKLGEMLFVSESIVSLLGYDRSEFLGVNWQKLIEAKHVIYIKHTISGLEDKRFNLKIFKKQEEMDLFECQIVHVEEDRNYCIGIFKAIPYKEATETMVANSEKMSIVGQFAAGIAHEIRNPLTSLKGFLELLQAGIEQKEVYYQIMAEEIEKIESLTAELLYLSKPLTNNKRMESVHSMIEDVLILFKSQAKIKNINIKHITVTEEFIYCDRSQIKQVFTNLIKNAIEIMDAPGKIEIIPIVVGKTVEIAIIDEGPGIPEDMIDMIGEPFFTTKEDGTGLGLMMTNKILKEHEGLLKVIQNDLKGSTFKVVLPQNIRNH